MDLSNIPALQLDVQRTTAIAAAAKSKKNTDLYQTCQQFEAIFVKQMLQSMRDTVPKNGLLSGGFAEDIYQDMLYDQYSLKIAENAHLGIADMLYQQLQSKTS